VITDPPEIATAFDIQQSKSLLTHLDIETCKGAMLQVMLFKNSILDTSRALSDRVAELFKHATRLLGKPDSAKQIRLIEKTFGLERFYRKTGSDRV
jgi:hypothetical protein